VIDAPVRTEDNAHCACQAWPEALAVARHAAAVLAASDDSETFIPFDSAGGNAPTRVVEVAP
jgi:hypothetical protein